MLLPGGLCIEMRNVGTHPPSFQGFHLHGLRREGVKELGSKRHDLSLQMPSYSSSREQNDQYRQLAISFIKQARGGNSRTRPNQIVAFDKSTFNDLNTGFRQASPVGPDDW